MAQDYAASVAGTHIRITRLQADGTLATGANASYVTKAFISLGITPENESGDEFTQKTAGGEVCISVKTPDTLKRVTLQIAICNPDPEFTEIASGGTLVQDAGTPANTLGWLAAPTGTDALPNGVAVEVWAKAMVNGKPAASNPYYHWLIPYAILTPSGDRVIQNDILATTFEGWGVGNAALLDGAVHATAAWPSTITDRAYGYIRTSTTPSGNGYVAITP
jgi:hypothetical protein